MLKKLIILLNTELDATPASVVVAVPFKKKVMGDLAWLVIFCYTLLIFNPILPIATDIVAHTFWEKEHIMTVHQENGKFHVHWDLVRNAKQSEKDKNAAGAKSGSEDHLFEPVCFSFEIINELPIVLSYPRYTTHCPEVQADSHYRPPRVV